MQIRAERLSWVPAVLVGIGLPFLVECPDDLRDLPRALAGRLDVAAGVNTGVTESAGPDPRLTGDPARKERGDAAVR